MEKYDPEQFAKRLTERLKGKSDILACPFCGGEHFTTTGQFASILIADNLTEVALGPSIPSGMLVCENCGHIEFFALGSLGLLPKREEEK